MDELLLHFADMGGYVDTGFPVLVSPVYRSMAETPYLTTPGVVAIAKPHTSLNGLRSFLESFDNALNFPDYLNDPTMLTDGAQLDMFAGQVCYYSLGTKRTMRENASRYFDNIKVQSHGSVLEHSNYSFLLYGISRSLTHELIRHRHFSFSQVSQRYVSGKMLRFVERPEYQQDPVLHHMFLDRIDRVAMEYAILAERVSVAQQLGSEILSADSKTDLRKKVNLAARACLTNETEAPLVITGNARAWRHFLEMRASEHAEVEIRALAMKIFLCLVQMDTLLFNDYSMIKLKDGSYALETQYRKV